MEQTDILKRIEELEREIALLNVRLRFCRAAALPLSG